MGTSSFPVATTRFIPLFAYEAILNLIGMVVLLWVGAPVRATAVRRRHRADVHRLVRRGALGPRDSGVNNW